MVNGTSHSQATTLVDLTYEYQWLEELLACTEAVLFLLTSESCQAINTAPAVWCLLQSCDDMSKQIFFESDSENWTVPIDTQSIAAKVSSANKLAQNHKEQTEGLPYDQEQHNNWLIPVQQLCLSLHNDLNIALKMFPQHAQKDTKKA